MAITTASVAPLTTTATKPKPKRKSAKVVAPATTVSEAAANASFRKKYGIPPKGAGPHPPSSYGFPLPPAGHPDAKKYARSVLSRAHQGENFDPKQLAAQVAKARRILGEPPKKESGAKPLRDMFMLREVTATDGDDATATVILIRSGHGNLADRHYYTAECLAEAVATGVFESAQCYTDHPTRMEDIQQPERSVKNLAGWFSDCTLIDYADPELGACKAIEATFHPQIGRGDIIGMLRTCAEYAKRYPHKAYVGLSINAAGDGAPAIIDGEEWNQVDRITEVVSVDLVTRAGAGGRPIALQESYKMASATKTIDPAKLKAAVIEESGKSKVAFLAALKESAIQLTPEQDAALDAALGIVDGGALDRAIDAATGVSPEDDEDDEEEESDDMGDGMTTAAPAAQTDTMEDDMMEGDEEVTEADLAPLQGKSSDELMQIAAKHMKKAKKMADNAVAAKTGEMDAPAKESQEAKEKREAAAAIANANAKVREANAKLKERVVKDVLAAQNVPENFRPRLTRELMERATLTSEKQIAAYVTEFGQAIIKPIVDGAGTTFRESGFSGGAGKIEMTFTPAAAYAD
jgi:hypothetical protein